MPPEEGARRTPGAPAIMAYVLLGRYPVVCGGEEKQIKIKSNTRTGGWKKSNLTNRQQCSGVLHCLVGPVESIVGGDAHPGTLTSMAPSTSLALASLLRDQGKYADAATRSRCTARRATVSVGTELGDAHPHSQTDYGAYTYVQPFRVM